MYAVILDDAELNNLLMTEAVRSIPGCEPMAFTNPQEALGFVRAHAGDIGVAITDFDMPVMNGIEFIRAARNVPDFDHVPIVMVTSNAERSLRCEALEAGATDFMYKPFDAIEVKARITNLLALSNAYREQQGRAAWLAREVAAAVAVIEAREREIVTRLVRASEQRDTDTGDHVTRVAGYVAIIAKGLGFDEQRRRDLSAASTMHDVGKIAVPDSILLKQGALTPEERAVMERHTVQGTKILEGSASDLVQLAAELAGSHHERWDGQGYPKGLKGEEIPVSGRIVAVADVFDALTSNRPYKKAWPAAEARAYLRSNAGTQFDPRCVEAFLASWDQVLALMDDATSSAA